MGMQQELFVSVLGSLAGVRAPAGTTDEKKAAEIAGEAAVITKAGMMVYEKLATPPQAQAPAQAPTAPTEPAKAPG